MLCYNPNVKPKLTIVLFLAWPSGNGECTVIDLGGEDDTSNNSPYCSQAMSLGLPPCDNTTTEQLALQKICSARADCVGFYDKDDDGKDLMLCSAISATALDSPHHDLGPDCRSHVDWCHSASLAQCGSKYDIRSGYRKCAIASNGRCSALSGSTTPDFTICTDPLHRVWPKAKGL